MSWFPILLVTHVALAIALLAPSVLLPFLLRRGGGPADTANGLTRVLIAMQGTGSVLVAIGLALTGIALIVLLGTELLTQPWLLVALVLYAVNLLVAAFISRPNLLRLVGIGASGNEEAWRRRARRQRYLAYGMAAATGAIGLLMSTKPDLW